MIAGVAPDLEAKMATGELALYFEQRIFSYKTYLLCGFPGLS